MRNGRSGIVAAICAAMLVVMCAFAARAQQPPDDYSRLHKVLPQAMQRDELQAMRSSGQLFLVSALGDLDWLKGYQHPVGRLDIQYSQDGSPYSSTTCTANLLSTGVIVTAAHCIPGPQGLLAGQARMVMDYFSEGQTEAPIFKIDPAPLLVDRSFDIALLRAPAGLLSTYGGIAPNYRKPIAGETVFLISHPLGQGKRLSSGDCRVPRDFDPGVALFQHACATTGGSSGALLFGMDGAILGVHGGVDATANAAASLAAFLEARPEARPFFQAIAPPATVNSSGSVLGDQAWRSAVLNRLRGRNSEAFVVHLAAEAGGVDAAVVADETLTELAVRAGSLQALRAIQAAGARFDNLRGGRLLNEALQMYDDGHAEALQVAQLLLRLGAPLVPDGTGQIPPCNPQHRIQVRALFPGNYQCF